MSEDETVTNCNALKPERSRTFLEIVVSYPAFCTYPEYEGKPYYAIKFEENGETIVGFGTYKPEVLSQYLQEYFIPSAEPERKWIPVTEALPEEGESVIVSSRSGSICIAHLVKGISQETRRKMENGEIDNPDVKGWCLADGWTTSKRSNIFQEGDEWGNNKRDYAWRDGPYHYSGQKFIAWMPLPESYKGD